MVSQAVCSAVLHSWALELFGAWNRALRICYAMSDNYKPGDRKVLEKAIKSDQKWVLKKYCSTKRQRNTRYTSTVRHDFAVSVSAVGRVFWHTRTEQTVHI